MHFDCGLFIILYVYYWQDRGLKFSLGSANIVVYTVFLLINVSHRCKLYIISIF